MASERGAFRAYVVVGWFRAERGRFANRWRYYTYQGHWHRKKDAMREHAAAFGQTWAERYAKGDRIAIANIEVDADPEDAPNA